VARVSSYSEKVDDLRKVASLRNELELQWNRGAALNELLQQERDRTAVLRGTIGRLEDAVEKLLGYTECGCGEDEEGNYGQCVPCHIRDEGMYP
jgi:hypothetical protein